MLVIQELINLFYLEVIKNMNSIPRLKKYPYGKIYKCLKKCNNQVVFSNAISVEFYEEIPRDEIQGCLEAWLEEIRRGEYRINLF